MTTKSNGNTVMKIALAAALAFIVGILGTSLNDGVYATKAEARAIAKQEDENLIRYMDVKFDGVFREIAIHNKTHEKTHEVK